MLKEKKRFRRTTVIILGLAAFLVGLGFARTKLNLTGFWLLISAVVALISIRKMRWVATVAVLIFGFLLGWWRGQAYMQKLSAYTKVYGHSVVIYGTADNDAIYTNNSQLTFDLINLQVIKPNNLNLVGKLGIKGFGPNAIYRGDKLQVEGKLYQTRGAKQGGISFAQIKVLASANSPIDDTRRSFQAGMQSALPEPMASFGLGLLIGQRNTLPDKTTKQLTIVGLTHIVAISGYNLTIIIRAVRRLLKKRSKYQSTILSLSLIGLFILIAGSSPSINRAAIVSLLSLAAWYYGRSIKPVLIILLAAVLTAGIYPIYLWSDIGWYLSFLAFFGILVISPLIMHRIYKLKKPSILTALIIDSFAAQIMTIPLIMYIFKEVSIIALATNVLLVPLVPLAMLLALMAGLSGALLPAVAGWFSWPARILLTYMLDMISLMSRVPHALAQQILKLWQMLTLYGFVMVWTGMLWHKTRSKNATLEK